MVYAVIPFALLALGLFFVRRIDDIIYFAATFVGLNIVAVILVVLSLLYVRANSSG
jgi:hypothetical protein